MSKIKYPRFQFFILRLLGCSAFIKEAKKRIDLINKADEETINQDDWKLSKCLDGFVKIRQHPVGSGGQLPVGSGGPGWKTSLPEENPDRKALNIDQDYKVLCLFCRTVSNEVDQDAGRFYCPECHDVKMLDNDQCSPMNRLTKEYFEAMTWLASTGYSINGKQKPRQIAKDIDICLL